MAGAMVVVVVVAGGKLLAMDETTGGTPEGCGTPTGAVATTSEAEVPGTAELGETLIDGGNTTPDGRVGGSCDCVPYLMYCENRKIKHKLVDNSTSQ